MTAGHGVAAFLTVLLLDFAVMIVVLNSRRLRRQKRRWRDTVRRPDGSAARRLL